VVSRSSSRPPLLAHESDAHNPPRLTLKNKLFVVCWALCIARIFVPACLVVRIMSGVTSAADSRRRIRLISQHGAPVQRIPTDSGLQLRTTEESLHGGAPGEGGSVRPKSLSPLRGCPLRPFVTHELRCRPTCSGCPFPFVSYIAGLVFLLAALPDKTLLRSMIFCSALCSMPFVWPYSADKSL